MPSAEARPGRLDTRGRLRRLVAGLLLGSAAAALASPSRVATLGGDGRLLLDSTNLFGPLRVGGVQT